MPERAPRKLDREVRDRVTPELRAEVLRRDGCCVRSLFDDRHVCRDRFGVPHAPYALHLLTLDHVHGGYGLMGVRAPSDLAHLVATCWAANVTEPPSHEFRQFERRYLAEKNAVLA